MFRNKILVTTRLSSPSPSPFFLLHLSISDSSSPIEIESLCWKLSRRFCLACFQPSPSSIFVIYQRSQTESAAQAVEEIGKTLAIINVGEEEEVSSATLLAMAVECWFRSLMLEKSWRCVGDSTFVQSTFAGDEEKIHVQALNVRVQSENGVSIVFLVSPDVIWFTRDKIMDLVASRTLKSFHDGNIAVVEMDMLFTACTVLPTLYSGHIVGLSKLPPILEKFDLLEELWLMKHGLTLPSDYYVNILFNHGGQAGNQWFPSAFILRGSGLYPAPRTARSSMAGNALNSFIKTIGCSDFFSQGLLKVKEVSLIDTLMTQPVWKAAGTVFVANKSITSTQDSATDQCIISQNSDLTLDFRTPKPALRYISANRMLDQDKCNANAVLTREEITVTTATCSVKPPFPELLHEVVQVPVKANASAVLTREEIAVTTATCSVKPPILELLNEVVQVPVKARPLSQSKAYQKVDSKAGNGESRVKKKAKQHNDSPDVNSKVCDFHARGKLQSLTVSDLKCFLASRKVKVGGKKDELVKRVLEILG